MGFCRQQSDSHPQQRRPFAAHSLHLDYVGNWPHSLALQSARYLLVVDLLTVYNKENIWMAVHEGKFSPLNVDLVVGWVRRSHYRIHHPYSSTNFYHTNP